MTRADNPIPRRLHDDDGAALVEFALVMTFLFTLVFGIITFGLLLSFKQDMTRAAAEGARAGAVAVAQTGEVPEDVAQLAALTATDEAVQEFGGSFTGTGCGFAWIDCIVDPPIPCVEDASETCVTVEIIYDYDGHPLFGNIPLISEFMPDEVRSVSVARING